MMRDHVRDLLERVAAGTIDPAEALNLLATPQVESLPFATIDHHRGIRQGFPEVIYGAGKTDRQIEDGFGPSTARHSSYPASAARSPSAT